MFNEQLGNAVTIACKFKAGRITTPAATVVVQPLASFTITSYVPATFTVKVGLVWKPLPILYWNGPTPERTFTVKSYVPEALGH
ncbi:hypothetical protein D3C80_1571900 [compost metagenome]